MFDKKHNAKIAQILKEEHLVEMTPDQVDATRKRAFAKIRAGMVARGYEWVGDLSDEELLAAMADTMRRKRR